MKKQIPKLTILTAIVALVAVVAFVKRNPSIDHADLPRAPALAESSSTAAVEVEEPRAPEYTTNSAAKPTIQAQLGFVILLHERMDTGLTQEEAVILDRLYADLVKRREQLELELATIEKVGPNSILIQIPEYYEKGISLYTEFLDGLRSEVPGARGTQIVGQLDSLARAANYDFGITAQDILVEVKNGSYTVLRGSGSQLQINGKPHLARRTTSSELRPDMLGSYAYLKDFFPAIN